MVSQKQPSHEGSEQEPNERTRSNRIRKDRFKNKWFLFLVVAIVVLASSVWAGYLVGRRSGKQVQDHAEAEATASEVSTWYCSMHPQITSPKPGKCAICFMDLIPLEEDAEAGPRQLKMTPEAMKLAEIQTTPVKRHVVTNHVRMVG
jgi:Cu(I)/Ag(I) efflux system membrane fusion protein